MKMQLTFDEKEVCVLAQLKAQQLYPNHIVTGITVEINPAYDSGRDPRERSTSATLRGVTVEMRHATETEEVE